MKNEIGNILPLKEKYRQSFLNIAINFIGISLSNRDTQCTEQ